MDNCRKLDSHTGRIGMNGLGTSGSDPNRHGQLNDHADQKRHRNYRLIIDPVLKQGPKKVYSYDGIVLGETSPVVVRDPRSRMSRTWGRKEVANLPVPIYKYDQYSVGTILPKEVTFVNLNNNVNQAFLRDMCKGIGNIEDVIIYYHPKSKRHLGIGMVLFSSTKAAKFCAEKFNQTTTMGNIMTVFVDVMGQERSKLVEAATAEKLTTFHPPSPKSKLPADVLIHHPTPVDEFRSPAKAIDTRVPSAGNVDPRSHHHPDSTSSLSSPLTREWNRTNSTAPDLLTPTHSMSPFPRDVMYVPPLPSDPGYSDNQPLNPPLPPVPYPYNGLPGYETILNHANVHGPFLAQDRVCPPGPDCIGSRYDNHHERFSKSKHFLGHGRGDHFRGKRDDPWEGRRNGQQRWESPSWSRTPYTASHSNGRKKHQDYGGSESTSSVSSYHDLEDRESCGDSWDGHRYDGGVATRTYDQAAGHGDDARFSAANLEMPGFAEPEEEEHTKPPQSLESRIQAMLGGSLPFMQLQKEEESVGSPRPPDLSEGATKNAPISSTPHKNSPPPPLPPPESEPPPLPPLPMEDDPPPPLPPDPTSQNPADGIFLSGENAAFDNQECGADVGLDTTADSGADGVTFCTGNDDDDDRMSLSSLSSGGEKLEVIELNVEVPGCSFPWMMNPMMMQNNFRNNDLNQQMFVASGCSSAGGPVTNYLNAQMDERKEEPEFLTALDEVISELKMIMGKDMRKKMVESTAFKSFETWWQASEAQEKDQPAVGGPASFSTDRSSSATLFGSVGGQSSSASLSSHQGSVRAPDMASSTLASLFDNSDSGHFGGGGGLLGLRGAMPKMPSFKKKFRPPSPPPADEGEGDEEFIGPRTPEDSENEEKDKVSDESSDDSDMEPVRSVVKPSNRVIYSSDSSDSESEKVDSDAEEVEEEMDAVSSEGGSEDEREELDDAREERHSTDDEEEEEEEEEEDDEEDRASSLSVHPEEDIKATPSKREDEVENADISPPSVKDTSPDVESEVKADDTLDDVNVVDKFSEPEEKVELSKPFIEPGNEVNRDADVKDESESPVSHSEVGVESHVTSKDKDDEMIVDVDDSCRDALAQLSTNLSDSELDVVSVPDKVQPASEEPLPTLEEVPCTVPPVHQPILSPVVATEHNYFSTHETPPHRRGRKDHRTSLSSNQLPVANVNADLLPCNLPVLIPSLHPDVAIDHNYCQRFHAADESQLPMDSLPFSEVAKPSVVIPFYTGEPADSIGPAKDEPKHPKSRVARPRSHNKLPLLADIANVSGSRELAGLFPYIPPRPRPQFVPRDYQQEVRTAYDFLIGGIDQEDVEFLKRGYEELLQDDSIQTYWLNDTHWVDHPTTFAADSLAGPPPLKKRKLHHEGCVSKHLTGSARTEGYYKISHQEKRGYLFQDRGVNQSQESEQAFELDPASQTKKKVQQMREARSESRRLQSFLESLGEDVGDLLKFNQLKFRKKQLKFARSGIHDWGLFALEPIQEGEMVIEYVGQVVRQSVADLREKRYEAFGIGSSYLFRVDGDAIVDATKYGNLARFINHCCSPNCCAKIVTVESQKKIVIYSKRDIGVREEITYDYKFPLEEDKIRCLCGAVGCRGSLN